MERTARCGGQQQSLPVEDTAVLADDEQRRGQPLAGAQGEAATERGVVSGTDEVRCDPLQRGIDARRRDRPDRPR